MQPRVGRVNNPSSMDGTTGLRKKPNDSDDASDFCSEVSNDSVVDILGEETSSSGTLYYKLPKGYIKAKYVTIEASQEDSSDDEECDDDEYIAEAILDCRCAEGWQLEYLVLWRGYPREQATWEPTENVAQCDAYKEYVRVVDDSDDSDYDSDH